MILASTTLEMDPEQLNQISQNFEVVQVHSTELFWPLAVLTLLLVVAAVSLCWRNTRAHRELIPSGAVALLAIAGLFSVAAVYNNMGRAEYRLDGEVVGVHVSEKKPAVTLDTTEGTPLPLESTELPTVGDELALDCRVDPASAESSLICRAR